MTSIGHCFNDFWKITMHWSLFELLFVWINLFYDEIDCILNAFFLCSYNWMLDDDILNDLNDLDDDAIAEESEGMESELASMEGVPLRISELFSNPAFREHVEAIKSIVDAKINQQEYECSVSQDQLIQCSNEYASAIAKEIAGFFRGVKAVYGKKFP